jgi:hypothetical protein
MAEEGFHDYTLATRLERSAAAVQQCTGVRQPAQHSRTHTVCMAATALLQAGGSAGAMLQRVAAHRSVCPHPGIHSHPAVRLLSPLTPVGSCIATLRPDSWMLCCVLRRPGEHQPHATLPGSRQATHQPGAGQQQHQPQVGHRACREWSGWLGGRLGLQTLLQTRVKAQVLLLGGTLSKQLLGGNSSLPRASRATVSHCTLCATKTD